MSKRRKSFGKVLSPYGGIVGGSLDILNARWGVRNQPAPDAPVTLTTTRPSSRRHHGAGNDKAWTREMRRLPCHYCGGPGGTIDHLIPRSHGGRDIYENSLPACHRCNNMRGAFSYDDFMAAIRFGILEVFEGVDHPRMKHVARFIMSAVRVLRRPAVAA